MWTVLFDVPLLSRVQKRWRAVEDFSQIKDKIWDSTLVRRRILWDSLIDLYSILAEMEK